DAPVPGLWTAGIYNIVSGLSKNCPGEGDAARDGRQDSTDDDYRISAQAELVYREPGLAKLPRGDGRDALPRAVRGRAVGLYHRADHRGPRYLDRRRRAVQRRYRRAELDELSAVAHVGLRSAAEGREGRRGRHRVPARAHPARLYRSARDAEHRRSGRARQHAVRRDLEGRAAHD